MTTSKARIGMAGPRWSGQVASSLGVAVSASYGPTRLGMACYGKVWQSWLGGARLVSSSPGGLRPGSLGMSKRGLFRPGQVRLGSAWLAGV